CLQIVRTNHEEDDLGTAPDDLIQSVQDAGAGVARDPAIENSSARKKFVPIDPFRDRVTEHDNVCVADGLPKKIQACAVVGIRDAKCPVRQSQPNPQRPDNLRSPYANHYANSKNDKKNGDDLNPPHIHALLVATEQIHSILPQPAYPWA